MSAISFAAFPPSFFHSFSPRGRNSLGGEKAEGERRRRREVREKNGKRGRKEGRKKLAYPIPLLPLLSPNWFPFPLPSSPRAARPQERKKKSRGDPSKTEKREEEGVASCAASEFFSFFPFYHRPFSRFLRPPFPLFSETRNEVEKRDLNFFPLSSSPSPFSSRVVFAVISEKELWGEGRGRRKASKLRRFQQSSFSVDLFKGKGGGKAGGGGGGRCGRPIIIHGRESAHSLQREEGRRRRRRRRPRFILKLSRGQSYVRA